MSHTVRINFERIADECHAVCDRIVDRVAGLELMLDIFNQFSDEDIDIQSQRYIDEVRQQAYEWNKRLELMRTKCDWLARKGVWDVDSDDYEFINRYKLKDEAYALMRNINAKIAVLKPQLYLLTKTIKAIRKERRKKEAEERRASRSAHTLGKQTENKNVDHQINETIPAREKLHKEMYNTGDDTHSPQDISIREGLKIETQKKKSVIDGIQDEVLKQFTYMAQLSYPSLQGEELLKEGTRMMYAALEQAEKEVAEKEKQTCMNELEAANVSKEEINSIMSINTNTQDALIRLYDHTAESVVGETVRRKSLNMIMKAIKAQGFIVNKSSVIRKGDSVILTARKVGGETARFNIYLDGRFIYDFQGYEGQTCQKDIQPFMKDLQDIYGFTIKETVEIWSNPDKIETSKIQTLISGSNKK